MKLIDNYNRVHSYLRISLTDRCNLNCIYCNPADMYQKGLHKKDILSYEEILRTIHFFAGKFEFKKFRFTGGEPLSRRHVFDFFDEVKKIKDKFGLKIGLTTNGTLLCGKATRLKNSGIDNLNISLDSLQAENFHHISGKKDLQSVLSAIDEAEESGFNPVKINMVVLKNMNSQEILDFVDFVKDRNLNVRFIEFMPFGNNNWEADAFISFMEMKEIVESKYELQPLYSVSNEVAKDFQLINHTGKVSFITSISDHFCGNCNRLRVSADGRIRTCLFSTGKENVDFKELLRNNYSENEIAERVQKSMKLKWEKHPDPEVLAEMEKNNMLTIGG